MKKSIYNEGLTYFLVVLFGFSIDLAIFSLLSYMDINLVIANSVAFLTGMTCNVILVRTFVFNENKFSLGIDLFLTVIVNVAVFTFGTLALTYLVDVLSIQRTLAKLISNSITLIINFSIRAIFFRKF